MSAVGGSGSSAIDPRTPVLVGVGAASLSASPVDLMVAATRAAATDAGASGLVERADRIAVPQGSWTIDDPGGEIAGRVGASSAESHLYEMGIPQQSLINDALAAILTGRSEVALVVGGEARRWERSQEGEQDDRIADPSLSAGSDRGGPDVLHARPDPLLEPVEAAHRLWEPVQQYAMIENALRYARRLAPDEHRRQVADLWARFNRVATGNPRAAFPEAMDAVSIATAGQKNRPLAAPYNKWHASQWTVDQAAALLLCSAETARRIGVPLDRWVFPHVALESSHAVSLLRRAEPHSWPAMGVLGRAAAERLGRPVSDSDVIEVYSCFPSAVRVQQQELGLGADSTPTVTGGMAFAGGPFNNFVLQSMVPVIERLRDDPSVLGAVTTVSGLLTKPGLGVWGATPDGRPPLLADLAAEAAASTGVVGVIEELGAYRGEATVTTYTVTFDGCEPVRTIAVCDVADGRRCVAISEEGELASFALETELIGRGVRVEGGSFTLVDV